MTKIERALDGVASNRLHSSPTVVLVPQRRTLASAGLDLWLVGGASLIFWVVMVIASAFRDNPAISRQFANVAATAGAMSLLVNYPHFMISYKIAYGRGWRFIRSHWLQLVLAPSVLLGLLTLAGLSFSEPNLIPAKYNPLELRFGEGLTALLITFMFLSVGWHYIKQTFGCMMISASFDDYRLERPQRRWLLLFLYSMMILNFVAANSGSMRSSSFYGVPLFSLGLPLPFYLFSQMLLFIFGCAFLYSVIWKKWRALRRWPPPRFWVPLAALMMWWFPLVQNPEFFLLVPLFHSLQYLPFAFKYERRRNEALGKKPGAGIWQILGVVIAGYFAFEILPYFLNQNHSTLEMQKAMFFVVAAHVFINVHHYLIDNVIWRFHQPEIQDYILEVPRKRPLEI